LTNEQFLRLEDNKLLNELEKCYKGRTADQEKIITHIDALRAQDLSNTMKEEHLKLLTDSFEMTWKALSCNKGNQGDEQRHREAHLSCAFHLNSNPNQSPIQTIPPAILALLNTSPNNDRTTYHCQIGPLHPAVFPFKKEQGHANKMPTLMEAYKRRTIDRFNQK
jgi:hypothetical protein